MKKIIAAVIVAALSLGLLAPNVAVYADENTNPKTSEACKNYKGNKNSSEYKMLCGEQKDEGDAEDVVKNVLNVVFLWVGIVAVIVVIIGGVMYMTAQGEASKIVRAKNAILYALIGLIVALLSFAIVNFVLGKLS